MTTAITSPAKLKRLEDIIRAKSFVLGHVVLASGKESDHYFNMKPTMLDPEGANVLASLILGKIDGVKADGVGGLEMGAVPLATAIAMASHARGKRIPAFFVRKQAKSHGAEKLVEGLAPGESLKAKRCVIIEDVTTTGGSSMKAIEAVRAEGGVIACVITVVDRNEGAKANFAAAGYDFRPLLTTDDFN